MKEGKLLQTLKGHRDSVNCLTYSRDGKTPPSPPLSLSPSSLSPSPLSRAYTVPYACTHWAFNLAC